MGPKKSVMKMDVLVASRIRRVAGYEGRRLSAVLADMLEAYVQKRWPGVPFSWAYPLPPLLHSGPEGEDINAATLQRLAVSIPTGSSAGLAPNMVVDVGACGKKAES